MDSNKGKDNENMKKLREARASKNNYSKLTQKTVNKQLITFLRINLRHNLKVIVEKVNEEITNKIYSPDF